MEPFTKLYFLGFFVGKAMTGNNTNIKSETAKMWERKLGQNRANVPLKYTLILNLTSGNDALAFNF